MTASVNDQQPWNYAALESLKAVEKSAFTVDVEEWFQVGAFENTLARSEWSTLESRVDLQTNNVIALLDKLEIKATFFCLGWVAKRCPSLIQKIADHGHEVACHGMDHRRLYTMERNTFQQDIRESKALLEDASGQDVVGYRAPSFSLNTDVWWVYEVLEQAGFKYSSSLYPVQTDHYGMAEAPRAPFYPQEGSQVLEIPMTVCNVPFKRLPASGGGYFRLLPYMLSKYLLKNARTQTKVPGIFYMHPWEMDPGQPFVKEAPFLSRFRHYTAQSKLPKKIEKWAEDFSWGRMDEVYAAVLSGEGRG